MWRFLRPPDQELRNVIDKLAQFVARNGPEFEKMTMEKQKDNPKFSFLFGGEFYSYYKCKLALEQQQRESSPALGPPPLALPFSDSISGSTTKRLIWGRMLFLCENGLVRYV